MKRLTAKLTYANVVSTIALFLVIAGGSAIAAGKLTKNSVGTKQLKNSAVTTAKLKDGAVTGSKVEASTLGTVPKAADASHAAGADTAAHAINADNAAHALNADNAGHATVAANAETLGGKSAAQLAAQSKLGCPTGMKLEMGLCFETSTRPAAAVSAAISTCESLDRWLPDIEQVIAFQTNNLAAPQPEEWTDTIYENGIKEFAYTAHIDALGSGFRPQEGSQSHAFRCVVLPSN